MIDDCYVAWNDCFGVIVGYGYEEEIRLSEDSFVFLAL